MGQAFEIRRSYIQKKVELLKIYFQRKNKKKSEVEIIAISHESLINYYNILEID